MTAGWLWQLASKMLYVISQSAAARQAGKGENNVKPVFLKITKEEKKIWLKEKLPMGENNNANI